MKPEQKILIVDDDSILRDFYSRVLVSEGYAVAAVGNGEDATRELEKGFDFALAIIDLLMPIRTGWELIEYMKAHTEYENIPVVVLTGLAASFNEFHKAEENCDAILHKGNFEISELLAIINNLTAEKE